MAGLPIGLHKVVSVPFRGSFIQMNGGFANIRTLNSFRPLPGILYSNEPAAALQLYGLCFRPLPGILYSNKSPCVHAVFRFKFPSPSGDPLFKWKESCNSMTQYVSVPFRGSFIQILSFSHRINTTIIDLPAGQNIFCPAEVL